MPKKRQHPHAHLLRLSQMLAANPPPALPLTHASLARPDQIKFEYAETVARQEPGRARLARMKAGLRQGPLEFFNNDILDHWAAEEFFWHGAPGDDWHPLEAYIAANAQRFSPAAQAQLRLWKEARIGFYEIGQVANGTVGLQEWDPLTGQHSGELVRAIALNLGGVGIFRGLQGQVYLTYLTPWSPEAGVYCTLGYGNSFRKRRVMGDVALLMLGLRQPTLVFQPYPWLVSQQAEVEALRVWHVREWQSWLAERLSFPFQAFVQQPPRGEQSVETITELMPAKPENARNFGIYLTVQKREGKEVMVSGLTGIIPVDMTSLNWRPIAEYHAYRERVGPPPGTIGAPSFTRIR